MNKTYNLGNKVNNSQCNGIIMNIRTIPNQSGLKYLDFMYLIKFKDTSEIELSCEDFEDGWIKKDDSNAIEMRDYDGYYCSKCSKVLKLNETYVDDDRFVRCNHCHILVNVQSVDGD